MKVRALLGTVSDGKGKTYTVNDEFEVDDERGKYLLGLEAVERVDAPAPAVKRVQRRKTES